MARSVTDLSDFLGIHDISRSVKASREAGAASIRTFDDAFIPGLPVSEYMKLIIGAAGIDDPAEVTRRSEARTRRQSILTRETDPCVLHAIIDENVVVRSTDTTSASQIG